MSTSAVMPQPTRLRSSAPSQAKRPSIADITGKGSGLPNRYILHAVEGWGKTSFGAQTPKPIFIEVGKETGLETLIDNGLVADTPHFPAVQDWAGLLGAIEALTVEDHPYKTCLIDTINGSETMCHELVCHRDFGDDWGEKGFASYGKGPEIALPEWRIFLNALDRLRETKRMGIMLLCHTKVKTFKNPEGADYDRYQPDMHEKTWGLTHKWADAVFFGNFEVSVEQGRKVDLMKKGKGIGGNHRLMYTQRSAAYDAKNRLGLPPEVDMGDSAPAAWTNFANELKAARKKEEATS